MLCPSCQSPNPDEARFCLHCGASHAPGSPATPADPLRAALEQALGAHYEIVRLVGRGGMGAVYLARERALERAVAIKVLTRETAEDAQSRERFRREARTAANLTHQNIVPLHTFGEADGMLYFVMGYVRGESLADRMRREGRLPPDDVRRILSELADALDYAHRKGVVHRDIKPDNVLLDDESGRPLLTDFGVAKAHASGVTLTEAGAVMGTPHYMSPEQSGGARDIDGRSDLYSLAVMGYAMLAGRLPFEGDGFRDVIVQHLTKEPPALGILAPDAPHDLVNAVTRCLHKEPAARFADGRLLKSAINADSGDDETALRGAMKRLNRAVFSDLLFGPVLSVTYLSVALAARDTFLFPMLLFMAGMSLLGPVAESILFWFARRQGHSTASIKTAYLRPPRWWSFWWPVKWRDTGDVWERLPPLLRKLRSWRLAGFALTYTFGLNLLAIFAAGESVMRSPIGTGLTTLMFAHMAAIGTLFIGGAFRLERWGRAHGLDAHDSASVGTTPTSRLSFWRKPAFAALLNPPTARSTHAVPEPQSPADLLRAIGDGARDLVGPAHQMGKDALAAARQVVTAIAALDAEITVLARDASAAEIAAVQQKLVSLDEIAGESASRRELRQVLTNQLELLNRLALQLSDAQRRRDRLLDLMRTLSLQVANLRAAVVRDALSDGDISGRIRAVAAEIDAYSEAYSSLRVQPLPLGLTPP